MEFVVEAELTPLLADKIQNCEYCGGALPGTQHEDGIDRRKFEPFVEDVHIENAVDLPLV